MVHHNLNPRNVILASDGTVRVLNFGCPPQELSQEALTRAAFHQVGYLAPELIQGQGGDLRADLFSLGALLYEMLTGYPAFPEKSPQRVLQRITEHPLTPPTQINRSLPTELGEIVLKAMGRRREERYPNTLVMARLLERFMSNNYPLFSSSVLGSLMKGLFLDEIKTEIKSLYALSKNAGTLGGRVFRSAPVVLYSLVKRDPKEKGRGVAPRLPLSEHHLPQMVSPGQPDLQRGATLQDVADMASVFDVNLFGKARTSPLPPLPRPAFSDTNARTLLEGTNVSMFEQKETIRFDDEKSYMDAGNSLPSASTLLTSETTPLPKLYRSPTGYFHMEASSPGPQPLPPPPPAPSTGPQPKPGSCLFQMRSVLAFFVGMLAMGAIALLVISLTGCHHPQAPRPSSRAPRALP